MPDHTILVTGGAGYVGSGLIRALLADGYRVVCVDSLKFGGESLLGVWHDSNFAFHHIDICDSDRLREVFRKHEVWAVIHLAAIVGDPACSREPDLARATNWSASVALLDLVLKNQVSRFVFASTCSNYGKMGSTNAYVNEDSPLAPVSLYAELKVAFEQRFLEMKERSLGFSPTSLRFATVYGVSPRMRFDLTVNEFTKELALGRELVVFGEQFWRPYCHVRDFARAFLAVLRAPQEEVAYNVFNVGSTDENYTKKMLVEQLQTVLPDAQIRYVRKDEDPRDYRVNCDKIKETLGFEVSLRVPEGIQEVRTVVTEGIIADPDDPKYYNIPVPSDA